MELALIDSIQILGGWHLHFAIYRMIAFHDFYSEALVASASQLRLRLLPNNTAFEKGTKSFGAWHGLHLYYTCILDLLDPANDTRIVPSSCHWLPHLHINAHCSRPRQPVCNAYPLPSLTSTVYALWAHSDPCFNARV